MPFLNYFAKIRLINLAVIIVAIIRLQKFEEYKKISNKYFQLIFENKSRS
jgi:hypothetical protein